MWQPVEPTFTKLDIFGSESAEAPERVALRARYTPSRELDNVLITPLIEALNLNFTWSMDFYRLMDDDKMVGHIQGDALEAEPWDFRHSEPIVIWRGNLVEEASDEEKELRRRACQELHHQRDPNSKRPDKEQQGPRRRRKKKMLEDDLSDQGADENGEHRPNSDSSGPGSMFDPDPSESDVGSGGGGGCGGNGESSSSGDGSLIRSKAMLRRKERVKQLVAEAKKKEGPGPKAKALAEAKAKAKVKPKPPQKEGSSSSSGTGSSSSSSSSGSSSSSSSSSSSHSSTKPSDDDTSDKGISSSSGNDIDDDDPNTDKDEDEDKDTEDPELHVLGIPRAPVTKHIHIPIPNSSGGYIDWLPGSRTIKAICRRHKKCDRTRTLDPHVINSDEHLARLKRKNRYDLIDRGRPLGHLVRWLEISDLCDDPDDPTDLFKGAYNHQQLETLWGNDCQCMNHSNRAAARTRYEALPPPHAEWIEKIKKRERQLRASEPREPLTNLVKS